MGGSDEEVYYSMVRLAESVTKLDWPWQIVQDALPQGLAVSTDPRRGAACHRSSVSRRSALPARYLFAQRAAQIPLPEDDLLFVGADVYAWRAIDEQAVCAS